MPKYIKCPRCDLNYIEEDKELCEVCLAERQGRHLRFADIDEFGSDDSEATKLCPICGENYISLTESCCEEEHFWRHFGGNALCGLRRGVHWPNMLGA